MKRKLLFAFIAVVMCIALMATGCSKTEEPAAIDDADTGDVAEEVTEDAAEEIAEKQKNIAKNNRTE